MKCENRFCIYEDNGHCTVKEISVDSSGMCADCLYPTIDEDTLTNAKQRLLRRYQEQESDSRTPPNNSHLKKRKS